MRRICLSLLMILLLAQGAAAGPLLKMLTHKDAGAWIKLKRSMVSVIELDINPTTGAVWEAELPEDKNIRILGRQYIPSRPGMLGSGGVEKIYVAGIKKGRTSLALALRRAYEHGAELRRLKFNFESDGQMSETFTMPELNLSEISSSIGGIQSDGSSLSVQSPDEATPSIGLPRAFNWCDEYGCTPIKNQGNCGACWAFSTTGVLENLIKVKDNITMSLSEQYLISCNRENYSCYGGWWAHDYHQWKAVSGEQEAGAVSQNDKPYLGRSGSCNSPNSKVAKIDGWGYVGGPNSVPSVDAIKQAISEHGPVAAAVCVNYAFNYYRDGVFSGPGCRLVNHGVVIVGWNDDEGCWIIRNSFGPDWGENGYMRIKYGVSNIGQGASWVNYKGGLNSPVDNSDSNGGCDSVYQNFETGGCS